MNAASFYPPLEPPRPGTWPNWWPINPAQQAYLNCTAELALFGGQSGAGKTQVLAADAMQEYGNPRLRALLLRTTLQEQQELEDIQQRLYEPKGARWRKSRWWFPSGATIRPGYLAHDKHLRRYQGNPYSWLGVDESGQHPEHRIRFMIGWLQAPPSAGLRVRGRFTSNPGDVGHCMDEADVLTPNGWVPIQDMRVGSPIFTVSDSGELVQSVTAQVHEECFDGELVRVRSRGLYMSCTDNHRVAKRAGQRRSDQYKNEKVFSLVPFSELPGQATIMRTVSWTGSPVPPVRLERCASRRWSKPKSIQPLSITGRQLCGLMGWFLSEGCLVGFETHPAHGRIDIGQSKPNGRRRLLEFLSECGFRPSWSPKSAVIYSREWVTFIAGFNFGKCRDKYVPDFIKNGTVDDLREFFDAAMEGDGHWVRRGLSGSYYTMSGRLADDMAEIAFKLGYVVTQKSRQRKGRRGLSHEVYFKTSKSGGTELLTGHHQYDVSTKTKRRSDVTREHYKGKVYCLGVPLTHNFIVRQKGTVWVSGNSWQMKVFLRNRCPVHYPASPADDRKFETSVVPGKRYRGACWTDDSPVHKTTAFFPAGLLDNPLLGREKLESLLSQSKAIQQQLLYGCWCNAAGLYFDFMRPDDVIPYASIGDMWWWQHFLSIDYGYGNSSAAAGMYAINPSGVVFKTRERIESKMSALKFAKGICKDGFVKTDFPFQGPQQNWLKKLKPRDPEKPRMSFCVMDEAMDQHRGTGKSIYDVMSDVFTENGVGCMKAAHDPAGNAQVLYNGLANKQCVLTRDSADLPLSYRSISSRIVDDRKAVKKIHGAWEDDSYDETSYAYNTWRQNSEKPARTALADELTQMRKDGVDETTLARIAWQRELALQAEEKKQAKGIRL